MSNYDITKIDDDDHEDEDAGSGELDLFKSGSFLPSLGKKRRREIVVAPKDRYIDEDGMHPILLNAGFYKSGSLLPKNFLDFNLMAKGLNPFIIAPENKSHVVPDLSQLVLDTLANIDSADYWEQLFLDTKVKSGILYVISKDNERYKVNDVNVFPGGEDGELVLTHYGKDHGRVIYLNILESVGFILPVVVLKPYGRKRR